MVTIILRTALTYFIVLAVVRLMGKREIGQLSAFDFVVAIMMAELAVIPLENQDTPFWHGFIPLMVLVILEIGISYLALHSYIVRGLLDGRPQIVVENGQILKKEMRKSRYNLDDLMGQLREKGYPNIDDIEFAILETSGKLSVIPKSQKRALTPADTGTHTGYEGMPSILIMDGVVMHHALKRCGLDESWLIEELKVKGYEIKDVFLVTLGTEGKLSIIPK